MEAVRLSGIKSKRLLTDVLAKIDGAAGAMDADALAQRQAKAALRRQLRALRTRGLSIDQIVTAVQASGLEMSRSSIAALLKPAAKPTRKPVARRRGKVSVASSSDNHVSVQE